MTELSDFPENTLGFIYKITNTVTGRIYIGQKKLYSTTKRNFGKKEAALITDKRKKLHEYVTKEMRGWRTYSGSCKPLTSDLENGDTYKKEILQICRNKAEITYYELKYQFEYGVIEPGSNAYNANVLGKMYRKLFYTDEDCL